jgi:hypothetical protein
MGEASTGACANFAGKKKREDRAEELEEQTLSPYFLTI